MRNILLGAALLTILALAGCATADRSLGRTTANITFPDGTIATWDNTKNIDVTWEVDPVTKKYVFSLKSITPETAMANVAASNAATAAALSKFADMIAPLIPAAAKAGALAGS